ncbi:hypothetical protein [Streptomyces sp. NBC_00102]|uniref:hypothetical protein n=1 Tax=Streptomyces sp. NBC_00102 TaxID=2975652 RepID=UPI00225AAF9A|nr:hypothetical protein [Streptomyces sp. NBC_00102]MCX5398972.1 hypothetical protein [Streptomyces sp. NBC_00102]
MPQFDDGEPVFRSTRDGRSWECNPRNPIGYALRIVGIVAIGVWLLLVIFRLGPYA